MTRVPRKTHPNARPDALIAQPLGQFREALSRLSLDELTMLQRRIGARIVGARWARGGHGVVRHQAVGELGRLSRREQATASEFNARRGAAPTVHVLQAPAMLREPAIEVSDELAA